MDWELCWKNGGSRETTALYPFLAQLLATEQLTTVLADTDKNDVLLNLSLIN